MTLYVCVHLFNVQSAGDLRITAPILFAATELETIRALFNEKEKELSVAVAKVDVLTRQLEEVRRGRQQIGVDNVMSPAALELDKLRKELLVSLFNP